MGIKDLLRFLKPHIEQIHIKKYAGKRVGIDAYSWLHKGAYSCSMELCLDSNSHKKTRYIDYFMHRINLLRHYKVTPVVVFDGGNIPCKAATETERHRRREANRGLAMAKLEEGNVSAASELFQRAVSVTPAMAHQLIQILRSENIEFVVAPYEADAQLAYLSSIEADKGGIVAVITEDSDLIAYGCPATVFKMDRYGNGEELVLDKLFDSGASKPSFRNFDKILLTGMCVLAGCDFLPSVPGIGIVKAHCLVSKYRNLDRVLSVLKLEKGSLVPEDYSRCFREAVTVFQHARIYDGDTKKLKHMKPLTQELLQSLDGELDFLGPEILPSVAAAIAEGNVNPTNMEAFVFFRSSARQPQPAAVIEPSRTLKEKDINILSEQESCFVVFSSHKTGEKEAKGMVRSHGKVSTENKYFNDPGLEKLFFPSKSHEKRESTTMALFDSPLKVPDNNPFKKRRLDEIHVSADSKDEKSEVLCVSPDNTWLKVHDNDSMGGGKPNDINFSQTESIYEEISLVTKVENPDVVSIGVESQETVNSKSKNVNDVRTETKRRCKKEVLKRNNRRSSESRNSILNFFSRV